jgi:hypothetical protein
MIGAEIKHKKSIAIDNQTAKAAKSFKSSIKWFEM